MDGRKGGKEGREGVIRDRKMSKPGGWYGHQRTEEGFYNSAPVRIIYL